MAESSIRISKLPDDAVKVQPVRAGSCRPLSQDFRQRLVVCNRIDIQVTSEQSSIRVDEALVRKAVRRVLLDSLKESANVSVAVVDDAQIRVLNRTHLNHDYATDTLSFVFEQSDSFVDGEIVVSAEMANTLAQRLGGRPHDELLLYVVHATLHLVGYDDKDETARQQMLAQENSTLEALGLPVPADRDAPLEIEPGDRTAGQRECRS